MNEPKTTPMKIGWRYSPKPRAAYGKGVASSQFLETEPAWNLAWLSHNWGNPKAKSPPQFTSAVRATLTVMMESGELDVLNLDRSQTKLASLMLLPPDKAVGVILRSPFVTKMPLHQLLGPKWTTTMKAQLQNSRVNDPVKALDECIDFPADQVMQAFLHLRRFTLKP